MRGTLTSSMCDLAINRDNEVGFSEYMDQSADFIRQVAPGSGGGICRGASGWCEQAQARDHGQVETRTQGPA